MSISPFALVICLVGLVIYLVFGPPSPSPLSAKASEVGRLMFFAGLLATLLHQGNHLLHLWN